MTNLRADFLAPPVARWPMPEAMFRALEQSLGWHMLIRARPV